MPSISRSAPTAAKAATARTCARTWATSSPPGHEKYKGAFLTAWYSGRPQYPDGFRRSAFDFVKLGPYIPDRGPLNKKTTNQRLYHLLPDGRDEDITSRFWRK